MASSAANAAVPALRRFCSSTILTAVSSRASSTRKKKNLVEVLQFSPNLGVVANVTKKQWQPETYYKLTRIQLGQDARHGYARGIFHEGECRTSLCHEVHKLWKSPLNEARPSNQISLSGPVGKGLAPLLPLSVRHISTHSALAAKQQSGSEERSETEITTQEDPFDTLTDKIPVQPVSVAEGASYSIAILAGLAVAAAAAYTIFKELIVEPKEYKVYGKALDRVQRDMQIAGRLGSPVHGYGQESQNRAARQRISNRQWVDEDGVEHVEVMFYVRGPGGGGKVFCEMFKDPEDKSWKFTYLIVDVTHPTPKRFLLESYVPDVKVNLTPA